MSPVFSVKPKLNLYEGFLGKYLSYLSKLDHASFSKQGSGPSCARPPVDPVRNEHAGHA